MKNLLLFIAFFFFVGCSTQVGYWQHYQECAVVEKTIKDISDCGKQSRMSYINESKSNEKSRSTEGDEYMLWAELLAKQVEDGEISEAAAKMKLLERNQMLAAQQRTRQLQMLSIWNAQQQQNKTLTCTEGAFGTMTCN